MYRVDEGLPRVDEFRALRTAVGWGSPGYEECRTALATTALSVVARHADHVVGMARAVGDTTMYLLIVDVVVHPEHQGKGLGGGMVTTLAQATARHGTRSLLLVADEGVVPFYEARGFTTEPSRLMRYVPAQGENGSKLT